MPNADVANSLAELFQWPSRPWRFSPSARCAGSCSWSVDSTPVRSSGGVVVEHYEHPGGLRAGRGYGVGNKAGGNPGFGREGGQDVCFKRHSALRCVEI